MASRVKQNNLVPHQQDSSRPPLPKKALVIGLIIIIGALAILGGSLYFVPKANLIVAVKAVNFNHDISVGISTTTPSATGQVIPGTFVESTEIGTQKVAASGQKLVGTKSSGTITIYSASDSKTFAQGTTLTAPNGLKLTLDKDVTVASGDAITQATISVSAHATDIGDKYNLPAGTRFSFGSLSSSDYLAKNDTALSGGASHQATVVTKDDQSKLLASLRSNLEDQAKTDLQNKVGSNQTLLPNAITSSVVKQKFSKDVDTESESVSLDLTMNFKGVVFSKDNVVKLFVDQFSSDIPTGYALTAQNSNVSVTDAKTDKQGNTTLSLNLTASLAPQIATDSIVAAASGKSFSAVKDQVKRLPGVTDVTLEVKPSFFASIVQIFLPWKKGSLTAEVVTQ